MLMKAGVGGSWGIASNHISEAFPYALAKANIILFT